jgi:hypothetical protein
MSSDKVVSLSPNHGISGQVRARKLLDSCQTSCQKHLKTLVQRMLDNADDALFAMADKAENNAAQTEFFDSMRIVRLHRRDIEKTFFDQIDKNFDDFWNYTDDHVQTLMSNDLNVDELSLVEETDLEESLAITNLMSKVKNNFGPDINAIEQRLAAIAPHITVNDDSNPMGPKAICEAFNIATKDLDTELKIKLVIFKLFDHQMIKDIGTLYDAVNNIFVEAGVMPTIKARIRRHPNQSNRSGQHMPMASGEYQEFTGGNRDSDYNNYADSESGAFISDLHRLLSANRTTSANDSGGFVGGGYAVGGGAATSMPPTPTIDVLAALSALQTQPSILSNGTLEQASSLVASDIRSAMGLHIGVAEGQSLPLNNMDNDMIDVVAMMFEFILEDPNLPNSARALISKLQIPMIKVAILDKDIFAHKNHPARKLLNELAKVGIALDDDPDENDPLLNIIDSIVESVINDFSDDITLFTTLLEQLETFESQHTEEQSSIEEKTRKEYETREQTELAKSWVRETLKETLHDKPMPKDVLKIVMGPWHDVMTHTYINEGEKSILWKNQLRFIDVLAWSVQPKELKVDKNKLGGIIKHLTGSLREGLTAINYPAEKIEKIFSALEPFHHASLYGLKVSKDKVGQENNSDASGFHQYDEETQHDITQTELHQNDSEQNDNSTSLRMPELEDDPEQTAVAAAIQQMEEEMQTLDDLEAMLDEEDLSSSSLSSLEAGAETELDKEIIEDIVLAGWNIEQPDKENYPDDEYLEMARHLEAGKWVEFTQDNKQKVRARLTWKSDLLGECTFTNWKFKVVADKTFNGFAADLRRGTARIIDDVPVLDRALSAVMTGLNKKAS